MREVGVPLSEAIVAWGDGAFGRAVDLMLPIRYRWQVLGGSWAQRDVFQKMLIEAAIRAGRIPLARALLAERIAAAGGAGASTWRRYAEVLAAAGAPEDAAEVRARADGPTAQDGGVTPFARPAKPTWGRSTTRKFTACGTPLRLFE